jgi:hypothetical protein
MLFRVASAMLAFSSVIATTATAYALERGFGNPVPEIDGPAGVAALAILACVGLMAYNRIRQ